MSIDDFFCPIPELARVLNGQKKGFYQIDKIPAWVNLEGLEPSYKD